RILAAIGYAGVDVPVNQVDIYLDTIPVMLASSPLSFDSEEMDEVMQQDTIHITVDMHAGSASGRAWGCDLSYDYVKINALYRT
ncbi:bifunctional ornithine acetyltransferase/N-acetylglutamate synthase, partial [Streptococcus dentasini]